MQGIVGWGGGGAGGVGGRGGLRTKEDLVHSLQGPGTGRGGSFVSPYSEQRLHTMAHRLHLRQNSRTFALF